MLTAFVEKQSNFREYYFKIIFNCVFFKGYILFITKFNGSSPNFNDASPNFEI